MLVSAAAVGQTLSPKGNCLTSAYVHTGQWQQKGKQKRDELITARQKKIKKKERGNKGRDLRDGRKMNRQIKGHFGQSRAHRIIVPSTVKSASFFYGQLYLEVESFLQETESFTTEWLQSGFVSAASWPAVGQEQCCRRWPMRFGESCVFISHDPSRGDDAKRQDEREATFAISSGFFYFFFYTSFVCLTDGSDSYFDRFRLAAFVLLALLLSVPALLTHAKMTSFPKLKGRGRCVLFIKRAWCRLRHCLPECRHC